MNTINMTLTRVEGTPEGMVGGPGIVVEVDECNPTPASSTGA